MLVKLKSRHIGQSWHPRAKSNSWRRSNVVALANTALHCYHAPSRMPTGHDHCRPAKRPLEAEPESCQNGVSLGPKRPKPRAPSLTITTSGDVTVQASHVPSADSLFDSDDALDDASTEGDSLFDSPINDDSMAPPTARAKPPSTPNHYNIVPAACRTAPPISGLFFDPYIQLPTELADQVLHQCKTTYFQNPSTNQIMLFGRATDPSSPDASTKPSNLGMPPFLHSLLLHLEELLRPSLPSDIHKLLFPPSSEPSRARQAIINLYRPGEGITPHVDLLGRFGDGIIGVSLGSGCVMDFRRASTSEEKGGYGAGQDIDPWDDGFTDEDGKRKRWGLYLPARSVLVMSGDARYRWTHGIEKKEEDFVERESGEGLDEIPRRVAGRISRGERLSITFRWLLPGAEIVGGSDAP